MLKRFTNENACQSVFCLQDVPFSHANLSGVFQFEEGSGSLPDPSLPLPHQLQFALSKIKEHVRTIMDTQATCKSLDEVS